VLSFSTPLAFGFYKVKFRPRRWGSLRRYRRPSTQLGRELLPANSLPLLIPHL